MPFRRFALRPARYFLDRGLEVYATSPKTAVSGGARLEDQRDARLGGDFLEAGAGLDIADEGFRFGSLSAELEICVTGCLSSVSLTRREVMATAWTCPWRREEKFRDRGWRPSA